MPRHAKSIVEYRNYDLPSHFPIILLSGERWHISDIPSGVLHFHNCMEIGLCESDSGTLEFEDLPCDFRAGDITVISGDLPHTTYSSKGTASKWTYLFVDAEELLHPFFPLDALPHSELFRNLLHDYGNIFSREENPGLYGLVCAIIQEMTDKPLNYEISVRGLFLALMTDLMRIHAVLTPQSTANSIPISPALECINQRYMDNFTMDDLANLCHMSSSHFRRVFSSIMGLGPLEHLNRTRIIKACSLLRMTEQGILEISEQVGFRSLSSFNRHFALLMGESPTEWRHKLNANKNVSILKYSGWL